MKSAQINSNKSVIFVCWRTRHFFPINHYMINEMNGNRQIDRQAARQTGKHSNGCFFAEVIANKKFNQLINLLMNGDR